MGNSNLKGKIQFYHSKRESAKVYTHGNMKVKIINWSWTRGTCNDYLSISGFASNSYLESMNDAISEVADFNIFLHPHMERLQMITSSTYYFVSPQKRESIPHHILAKCSTLQSCWSFYYIVENGKKRDKRLTWEHGGRKLIEYMKIEHWISVLNLINISMLKETLIYGN